MTGKLSMIIKSSLMLAIIVLAAVGTIYVLDIFDDAAVQQALGKVFAILGIFTGSALGLTVLANLGVRSGFEEPTKF